jgi:hypothetical protein
MAAEKAGALAFSLTWAFHRWAATAPRGPAPMISGIVGPIVRAIAAAESPANTASRRIASWVTAASTQAEAPGNSPAVSSSDRIGTTSAPSPARGIGMSSGTGTWGACHDGARAPSSPPPHTTTMWAPAPAAEEAASIVSSVLPENDTAKHSVPGPTNDGGA